ncbi:Zinc metallopeptidase [Pleurostoma richardsiae]|uniref:Zinc metallopeptidase n=1 Tax=Pleurostoma richardsiae TaxID=41990 RepID=A0AA38RN82_9PEZI|nr:Zinc metallopeptidase [Pleurostoma richardsiae]
MAEHDPLVLAYSHLRDFPREKDALQTLRKVASLVKPIMRARGWVVRELAEFYPDQHNLLGLNVNKGQRILLRLRYPGDRNQFLPIEQVTDTMLHELSHIVHGPHDGKFHALWNQLRDEHEGLIRKGYTGEGFLSEGHRLGGGRIPMHEARRLARAAAEKRRVLSAGSGQRLGGAAPRPGQDIRRVIVDAVERRNKTLQGCGNTNHDENEIQAISETATRNGFKTQAEEDAANDAAIAQALWELVQEDEKAKYGDSYIPPSAANPTGNGGGVYLPDQTGSTSTPPPVPEWSRPPAPEPKPQQPEARRPEARQASPVPEGGWTCSICTLHNPANYLCCDACGSEKPDKAPKRPASERLAKRPKTNGLRSSDLTNSRIVTFKNSRSGASTSSSSAPVDSGPSYWTCSYCGNLMERQWWTCSSCGTMKDSSK